MVKPGNKFGSRMTETANVNLNCFNQISRVLKCIMSQICTVRKVMFLSSLQG
jgi:hypothetical protein